MNQKENSKDTDLSKDILHVAKERFQRAEDAFNEIFKDARDDIKFSAGEQWPDEIRRAREMDNRPCLTVNKLSQIIHQVTNDQRQNRPAIKVSPVDDFADIETAKILQGLTRHIEYSSNADTAYDTAFDRTVRGGFGFFRIITDYCDPMSFDQEIRIKQILDQFSVKIDPDFQEPDGSDINWAFVDTYMSPDEFKAAYPSSEVSKADDWEGMCDPKDGWITQDAVRVSEYFYKEFRKAVIVQLSNGQVIEKSKLPQVPGVLPEGLTVVGERETLLPVIKWCKINGQEILEETVWPGQWIPVIPVLGEQIIVEGKRKLIGIVRPAKDPQRMLNYWKSAETETIALAPRAPFIGYEGQFEGHENEWRDANVKNFPYLEVKPLTIDGQQAPLPQRNVYEPPVMAISQASRLAADDIKATTGVYDASLGANSNEKSGIAIQRRNVQAQTSNFHFMDNLSKSIRHCGRIIVDLIPHIYDSARAVRILGEDGSEEIVKINQMFERNGENTVIQFNLGKYDVTVDTGPSFESKRQEAVAMMADLSKSFPQLMQVAGDIMVSNMDWPGAKEIAERIKKTLPPGLADDPKNKSQQLPPEVQQQMGQMDQMIHQLTQQLNAAHDVLDNKKLELESRERIEFGKIQAQLEMKLADIGSKDSQALLLAEVAGVKHRLDLLHASLPIEDESNEMPGPDQAEAPQVNQQQSTGEMQSPGQSPGG